MKDMEQNDYEIENPSKDEEDDAMDEGIASPMEPHINNDNVDATKEAQIDNEITMEQGLSLSAWNCCAGCCVCLSVTLIVLTILGLLGSRYVWDRLSIFSDASDVGRGMPSEPQQIDPYYPTPTYYQPTYPTPYYQPTYPTPFYQPTYPYPTMPYNQPASLYSTPLPTPDWTLGQTPEPTFSRVIVAPIPLTQDPQRIADLVAYINSITLSERTLVSSPPIDGQFSLDYTLPNEELALQWLIYVDSSQLWPNNPVSQFRLLQRYALLTLYLRLDPRAASFLLGEDECLWGYSGWGPSHCVPEDLGGDLGVQSVRTILDLTMYGSIPADLGLLTKLVYLHVTSEHEGSEQVVPPINGTLPSSLGRLTNLTKLLIIEADLTGTIPESLGQLTLLSELWLNSNRLAGPIPETLGQLVALDYVDLSENQITGTLPEAIGRWSSVVTVRFNINSLTGPLPNILDQWTNLDYFDVSNNQLTGTIPTFIANRTNGRLFISGNNFTVTELSCSCCNHC